MGVGSKLKTPKGQKHVMVIPVSLQAHIAGILRHSIELAKRGVTVTFVGQKQEIKLLETFEELQDLDFNMVAYNDQPRDQPRDQPPIFHFLATVKDLFQPIRDKLLEDRRAGLPGPTCIISDRFLTWVLDVAKELNVPYYQFDSGGAIFVRMLQSYPPLFADGTLTTKEVTEGFGAGKRSLAEFDGKMKIPGVPALTHGEMLNSLLGIDFYLAIGKAMGESDGLIVNTFYELEAPQIDAIRQFWIDNPPPRKIPKLLLVGPISTAATSKIRSLVGDQDVKGIDCLQWLDGQPPQSVVYFCLGSIVQFTPQQIKELALAIEASEQRFLWVIKKGSEEAFSPDFEARMREKVLVVTGWVPQLQILQHSSIGGYVTHCGWNSIIESVASGVPLACWPQLKNDQFFNCRYLVDVLKIAVEVRPQEVTISTSTNPKKNEEFERAVRLLMSSEEGNAMRSRVQDLHKKAKAAVADGGATKKALDDFVECIPPTGKQCDV